MESVTIYSRTGGGRMKCLAKTILALVLAVVCLSCQFVGFAFADTPLWVRIVKEGTMLYTNASSNKITCVLEYSYYLKVLSEQGNFYLVELMPNTSTFPKITGYVLISEVEECDAAPVEPTYPTVTIRVSASNAQLFLSPLTTSEVLFSATNTQSLSYYGEIEANGNEWYYVYYCGVFGYVLQNCVTQPAVAAHVTPIKTEEPVVVDTPVDTTPVETEPQQTVVNDNNTTYLIVFVVLLACGLMLAVFLPSDKKQNKPVYFEEA